MSIDWTALGHEAVDLLRGYLMIDTTNPPGKEIEGAEFLAAILGRDGIRSEIVESAPGRANLMARLKGDGALPGIVLHHHIDVVYADRRYWSVDPFGGEIRDGYLYGRGAIDMKSTGIMHLAAILAIQRAKIPLKRDLVFLATADEEAGSTLRRPLHRRPAARVAGGCRVRDLGARGDRGESRLQGAAGSHRCLREDGSRRAACRGTARCPGPTRRPTGSSGR